jgi:hexosaminidase
MKKLLVLLFGFLAIQAYSQNSVQLIPQPVELKPGNGSFVLTRGASVSFNRSEANFTATNLAEKINRATGYNLKARQGNAATILLKMNDVPVSYLGNEGYTLEVSPKGVIISANQPAGLYYGTQTLLQLFPNEIESTTPVKKDTWSIPAVFVKDYPRFMWRGLMLDVSRNFLTKAEVKEYIDQMSRYKYNIFHWHLTDDNGWRIEIKSLPKLTEVGAWRVPRAGHFGDRSDPRPGEKATYGGFYTQDDIREIIKYAQDRNVTIIPEIDVPGHSMAAIASYPELCCTKDTSIKVNPGTNFAEWYGNGTFQMFVDNTLNPSDEKVYEFLDKVFTEMAALFPAKYIHVGGDECYKGFWQRDEGCQALMKKLNIRHVEDLQGYFMNRVEGILKSKGKKLLGWDEILEGGISPEATLMSWRDMKYGKEAARMGHDVIMTPTAYAYLDYCQGDPTIEPPLYANLRVKKTYSFEPLPEEVDPKFILGGQGNLWSEQLPTFRHAEYMTYPRAWALSEVFWSPKASRNWDNFVPRMENFFKRSEIANIHYSLAAYDAIVWTSQKDGKLWLNMDTEIPGLEIYYTLDDAMPDKHTAKYTQPVEIPDGPVTLRVITYRNGQPIGHLITLPRRQLESRTERM